MFGYIDKETLFRWCGISFIYVEHASSGIQCKPKIKLYYKLYYCLKLSKVETIAFFSPDKLYHIPFTTVAGQGLNLGGWGGSKMLLLKLYEGGGEVSRAPYPASLLPSRLLDA